MNTDFWAGPEAPPLPGVCPPSSANPNPRPSTARIGIFLPRKRCTRTASILTGSERDRIMSSQSEKERLERYHQDCLWVGRTMSPLRGTLRPPLQGEPPPPKEEPILEEELLEETEEG